MPPALKDVGRRVAVGSASGLPDKIVWQGVCPKCGTGIGLSDEKLSGSRPVVCHADGCGFSEQADYFTLLNLRTRQ
jgi:hypothetical protein